MEKPLINIPTEDRLVQEVWCQLLGGCHIDYYKNLTDKELELEYEVLVDHATDKLK